MTRLRHDCTDYSEWQAEYNDMHDAVDDYFVPDIPMIMFDQSVRIVHISTRTDHLVLTYFV